MNSIRTLLSMCPNESEVTFDGKDFAEILRRSENPTRGRRSIEGVHLLIYGHTRFVRRSINPTTDEQFKEMREKFWGSENH